MQDTENKNENRRSWNIRPYLAVGLVAFLVIAVSMIFFFTLFRFKGIFSGLHELLNALQAVVIGVFIAYLINPVVSFFEKRIKKLLGKFMGNTRRVDKISRGAGISVALLIVITAILVLMQVLVPRLIYSFYNFGIALPVQMNRFVIWAEKALSEHTVLADIIEQQAGDVTSYVQSLMQNQLPAVVNSFMQSFRAGAVQMAKTLFNTLIGLIVAVYVLLGKEKIVGNAKKLIYAFFSASRGNRILKVARKSHEIFIGFITGKIIDALVLGILVYIIMLILQMPYSVLISVLMGVMILIPFFGQFIGIIGGTLIVMLDDTTKGITFLIVMIVVMQIHGNIIEPKIVGDEIGLSPLCIIVAILLGEGLFGVIGVFAGVPVFAILVYILGEIIDQKLHKKNLTSDPKAYLYVEGVDPLDGGFVYKDAPGEEPVIEDVPEEEIKENLQKEDNK